MEPEEMTRDTLPVFNDRNELEHLVMYLLERANAVVYEEFSNGLITRDDLTTAYSQLAKMQSASEKLLSTLR